MFVRILFLLFTLIIFSCTPKVKGTLDNASLQKNLYPENKWYVDYIHSNVDNKSAEELLHSIEFFPEVLDFNILGRFTSSEILIHHSEILNYGRSTIEFVQVMTDSIYTEELNYLVVDLQEVFFLLFYERNTPSAEFDISIIHSYQMIDFSLNNKILHLYSKESNNEFKLSQQILNASLTTEPKRINDNPFLNSRGLRGRVKSMDHYTTEVGKINFNYLGFEETYSYGEIYKPSGDLDYIVENGIKSKVEFYEKDFGTCFESEGDLEGNLEGNKMTRTCLNDSTKLITEYNNDHIIKELKTYLKNGRYHRCTYYLNKGDSSESVYIYNPLGYLSKISFYHNGVESSNLYYKVIEIDAQNNWTKRVLFNDRYCLYPDCMEIRDIQYYE